MKNLKMKSIETLLHRITFCILGFAALILACSAFPKKVQAAAPYESHTFSGWYDDSAQRHQLGGKYFWFDTSLKVSSSPSGSKTTIYTPKYNETLQDCIVSNGATVLYAVQKKGSSNITVYYTNLKTNKRKVYCTYKASKGSFAGYYNKKIYLKKPVVDEWGMDYGRSQIIRFDCQNKTYKTLLNSVGYFQQCGAYFGWSYPQVDPGPKTLCVYNVSSGKNREIAKYANARSIVNGSLYYVEWSSYSGTTGVLKCCKLNGTSKKTIASFSHTMPGGFSVAFGPKYAIVSSMEKYTRVYYQNGKKKASNYEEYKKVSNGF